MGKSSSDSSSASDSDLDVSKHIKKMTKKLDKERRKIEKEAHKMQAKFGREVFSTALLAGSYQTPSTTSAPQLPQTSAIAIASDPQNPRRPIWMKARRTHDIDERRPEYAEHGIIRVECGETVELVQGSIQAGLPSPYTDYVLVRTSSGKIGKVGKLCFA